MKNCCIKQKEIIPIFFAADENYLPYLAVALCSLKENASKKYAYEIYILNAGVSCEAEAKIKKYEDDTFKVTFVDVSKEMESVKSSLQIRDYYTGATYYRIFIAEMFPQLDKAIYIDSDVVVPGDISEFYHKEIGDNLVGAIADEAVASVPEFRLYTKEVLGIDAQNYFNAGVLLMNLKKFRESNFYGGFCDLLKAYKFTVAQDQDYLNVLCAGQVAYFDKEWNKMPIGGVGITPKLIHYNLTMKPWHYETTLYKEYFWLYAKQTEDYDVILKALDSYTDAQKQRDVECEKGLIALCVKEAEREDNYYKKYVK